MKKKNINNCYVQQFFHFLNYNKKQNKQTKIKKIIENAKIICQTVRKIWV